MVKDANNNWALNSATGGLDSFKAYQSTNSGDTYIDASNSTGHIRLNYETGSGTETDIYSGSSTSLDAAFLGPASIKFPGIAAASGHSCLQVDTSGYMTNTGTSCGSGESSGTINSGSNGQIAYYTASGTTIGGMSAVPVTAGGTGATSASGAMANLLPGVASDGSSGIKVTGNVAAGESIPATSPYVDIRAYGAVLDNATPIDSALQAAISSYQYQQGHSATILLPCAGGNGGSTQGNGCYLDNPSLLTEPSGYGASYKFIIQGNLRVGSTLVAPGWQNWYSDSGGFGNQFQTGAVPAYITGPTVNGTLGTAITTPGTAVTITPTFTNGNIAHLPAGSAITIAGLASSTATAARTAASNGYGQTVLTLASAIRIPPGEIITITGCSDSSFDATNIAVNGSDYSAQTLTYYQTTTTPSTATGCTVTGFNEDAFESARILCANGANMPGYSYVCGTGQITIATNHAHSASDQWGEVAVSPAFNTYTPQTWEGINIGNCYGACFWAEGSTNLVMNHMGAQASPVMTSIAMEQTTSYLSQIHDSNFSNSSFGQTVPSCPNGGCPQPSYPYALRCDSDVPGLYYGSSSTGCSATDIDQGTVLVGGIKIDGNGSQPISGLPRISSVMYEEPWGNAVTIDNRFGIEAQSCLTLKDQYLQDNISILQLNLLGYTDNEAPSGCVVIENNDAVDTSSLVNAYFNGSLSVNGIADFQNLPSPANASSPLGVFNEGGMLKGEIEGEGAGFGPSMLPFGSLPITTSTATWASLCTTYSMCTVTNVVGPDGPNGQMQAAQLVSLYNGAKLPIGAWTGATYPGDHFIYGAWVRPGQNETIIQGQIGYNDSFLLSTEGSDTFAPTPWTATNSVAMPTGFGTALSKNGWYPQVAIATITSGEATSHTISYYLDPGPWASGSNPATGNQFAQPFWTFIPGPNNPACSSAGTCNVTIDQIEEARQDQYHGFVPAGMSAGVAATAEAISANGYQVNGSALASGNLADWTDSGAAIGDVAVCTAVTSGLCTHWTPGAVASAPTETFNASASGAITLPSTDHAEATYVLSGNVTNTTIGSSVGGAKVTIIVCQPASGGPYTWAWPSNWKGGVTIGTTASTCSLQVGTYVAGQSDWKGDAGATNVPQ
jgi:hypothetical protein